MSTEVEVMNFENNSTSPKISFLSTTPLNMDEENPGVTSSSVSSEEDDGTEETLENYTIPLEEPETPLRGVFNDGEYDDDGSSEEEVLFQNEDSSKENLFEKREEEEVVSEELVVPKGPPVPREEEKEIPAPEEDEVEEEEEKIPEILAPEGSPVPEEEEEKNEVSSAENGESDSQDDVLKKKLITLKIKNTSLSEGSGGEISEPSTGAFRVREKNIEAKESREGEKGKKIEKSKQLASPTTRRKQKIKVIRRGGGSDIYFQKCVEQTVTIKRQKSILEQNRQEILGLKKKVGQLEGKLEQNPIHQQNRKTPSKKKSSTITPRKKWTERVSPSKRNENLIKRLQEEIEDLKSRLKMKDTVLWLLEKDVELYKFRSDPDNDSEKQSLKKRLEECERGRRIDQKKMNKIKKEKVEMKLKYRQLQCIAKNREDQIKHHSGIMTAQTKEIRRLRENMTKFRGQNAIMRKRLKTADVLNSI